MATKLYDILSTCRDTISNDFCEEGEVFLKGSEKPIRTKAWIGKLHLAILYSVIVLLSICLIFIPKWRVQTCLDLSLGIYSPADNAVSYKLVEFDKYFENRSPYTQTPSKQLEKMWEDLYNFGLSGISAEEVSKLLEPTAHLPHDNSTYVVTLGVFHQLHCVNHLRQALYPDEYPELWEHKADGTVDHGTIRALHRDHCIDILRQTLMCHGDVSPTPFFYRASDDNVYSVLANTHMCQDFDKIKDWALERQLTSWAWGLTNVDDSVSVEGMHSDE